jgi:hypothetical protein
MKFTKMIKTISRAPNDNFTFNLYTKLVSNLTCDFEAYYIWSNPPHELKNFLTKTKFTKPNVILGIKDLLDLWGDYNFWHDRAQPVIKLLDQMANLHSDKNFIIFTSLENIKSEEINSPNIQFIPWGGDIVNQADLYKNIVPVTDKNFNSEKSYISLNRNRRAHRLVLLSYLFGKEYHQYGTITYLGQQIDTQNFDNLLDCIAWEFDPQHDSARSAMLQGYTQFYNNKELANDDYQIYKQPNDNVTNFNQQLRTKYQDSFVEIVSESSFAAPSFLITEKVLNSMYGCNFPIILSGVGAVAHLKDIGFDVFDDVVDHRYDQISNPFDRIISAIEDNKQLLVDSESTKKLWLANKDRFTSNIGIANNHMYNWFRDRAVAQFAQVNWH